MEPFIGQIQLFGFSFAPVGWALCNGQLLPISQNTALFSLLGTMYGGDGVSTFGLPNLVGRVPIHFGNSLGFGYFTQGQIGGEISHTLITTEMPAHNHVVNSVLKVSSSDAGIHTPADTNSIAAAMDINGDTANSFIASAPNTQLNNGSIVSSAGITGGSQPHNNMQPYLVVNYCIALQGIFPSRN